MERYVKNIRKPYTIRAVNNKEYVEYLDECIWFSPIQNADYCNAFVICENKKPLLAFNYVISGFNVIISLILCSKHNNNYVLELALNLIRMKEPKALSVIIYLVEANDKKYLKNNRYKFELIGVNRKGMKIQKEYYKFFIYATTLMITIGD